MANATLWVFGYGSLMWDPGFAFDERRLARLEGYHRCFCMSSIHYRGTPERPGLVLALDAREGGACDGIALAVSPALREQTLAYLRERELISAAYLEVVRPLTLNDGRRVEAVTYIVDPDHVQYRGALEAAEQARIIAGAEGRRGANSAYLYNTARHLRELGIEDADLSRLAAQVRRLTGD